MAKDNKNTDVDNLNKKLHISDVIKRLSKLNRVGIYGFGGEDEDYPKSANIEKDVKQIDGRYVRYKDIKKLIDEIRNGTD